MKAVVFDFDGVIVRSMEQHADAYAAVLNPHGARIVRRDVLLREGARSETIIRDLMGDAGIVPTDAEVDQWALDKQAEFHSHGTPGTYPGAEAVLEQVWARPVQTAIVTGTRRGNLDTLIPNLAPRFDALVTQESYKNDKPHPEPYLTAAALLGVAPADCICVENAIRGIQSAKAAGYGHVIGITTTVSADDLATASPDQIVANHDELATALADALA